MGSQRDKVTKKEKKRMREGREEKQGRKGGLWWMGASFFVSSFDIRTPPCIDVLWLVLPLGCLLLRDGLFL